MQSNVGPTSVNGRLWRWFDVECQRWPVVILLIGSTLARLIGSTLARRYNVLFPTSIKGRPWRWFDVECQRWPVVILLIGSTLARLIGSTLVRRYNVLFPMVSRPIYNVCTLNVTNKMMVCFVLIQERCGIILIWRRPNDQTYRRGRRLADQCTVFERWILVGKPLEIRHCNVGPTSSQLIAPTSTRWAKWRRANVGIRRQTNVRDDR
jgi:uncharacterized membrane protein YhdT